jgi:hypothetical protein
MLLSCLDLQDVSNVGLLSASWDAREHKAHRLCSLTLTAAVSSPQQCSEGRSWCMCIINNDATAFCGTKVGNLLVLFAGFICWFYLL